MYNVVYKIMCPLKNNKLSIFWGCYGHNTLAITKESKMYMLYTSVL